MPMGVWRTVESEMEADYEASEYSYSYTPAEEEGRERAVVCELWLRESSM